jgi:hypothetical protein
MWTGVGAGQVRGVMEPEGGLKEVGQLWTDFASQSPSAETALNRQSVDEMREGLETVAESPFQPGQVWRYNNRAHEPGSTLTIVQIDPHAVLGDIIHVSVQGLQMKNPYSRSGFSETIAHMPFAEAALRGSVTELTEENVALLCFQDGYRMWKTAFDSDEGGIFTLSVAEAIDVMEQAMNQVVPKQGSGTQA